MSRVPAAMDVLGTTTFSVAMTGMVGVVVALVEPVAAGLLVYSMAR
ncbi:MAG: hypothetical protein ABR950_11605 [Candidatus Dormibacteria bacterium]